MLQTDSVRRHPLYLLPDAAKGALLTQPSIPRLYHRILPSVHEAVAPAVCMLGLHHNFRI